MSYGAMVSGIGLMNAGLGVVHGLASTIGGMFSLPHGELCGTLMAAANRITLDSLRKSRQSEPALARYAQLGEMFAEKAGKSTEYYQDSFIDMLDHLTAISGLRPLAGFGVTAADVLPIVQGSNSKNNPVTLTDEQLAAVITARL